ncbi:hypothetical protein PPSIR1_38209 [Plesiocystis pacifica SIR-1]|uniref:Uncharacterized protein n=1 Tax=Plesiocystis pacifica SIR-1 TaxID=391625 RepID=A6GBS1_9BACT|nr:hypothetical protein [Plesiocystis pacifica]EDM76688.1 hypothetical protein PPSIR1_38209 [Plesiocystis pacifica SIR-1]
MADPKKALGVDEAGLAKLRAELEVEVPSAEELERELLAGLDLELLDAIARMRIKQGLPLQRVPKDGEG